MSRVYLKRLNTIRDEYSACQRSLSTVLIYFDLPAVAGKLDGVTVHQIRDALGQLDRTYIVRLFAEFEGILKDHLRINHPSVKFNEDGVKVDWILKRVVQRENIVIDARLRLRYETLRRFRNHIAHRSSTPVAEVALRDSLESLAKIVGRLPDPFTV